MRHFLRDYGNSIVFRQFRIARMLTPIRHLESRHGAIMNSAIIKRSVVIAGKKTSVSLEDTFWLGLKEIAVQKRMPLASILDTIAGGRDTANLSSAVRQYVMQHFYNLATQSPRQAGRPELVVHRAAAY
jgi:predicted DNA-binding ribbon-helix-helix protein